MLERSGSLRARVAEFHLPLIRSVAWPAARQPAPDDVVRFTVIGAHNLTDSRTTGASGQCSFSYPGTVAGTDTITAYADSDKRLDRRAGDEDRYDPRRRLQVRVVDGRIRAQNVKPPALVCSAQPHEEPGACKVHRVSGCTELTAENGEPSAGPS